MAVAPGNSGVSLISGERLGVWSGIGLTSTGVSSVLEGGTVEMKVTGGTVTKTAVGMTSTTVPSGAWTTGWTPWS